LAGDPSRVTEAADQVLELLGQVCVQWWHGHALPARVVDDLADVPFCRDLVAVHRRSPSAGSAAPVGRRLVRTSTTPRRVRATLEQLPAERAGSGDRDDLGGGI
jgi:hypothetical protein